MAPVVTPREGLERLRAATTSGDLRIFCRRWHVTLLTVFGSAGRGEPDPRDLDIGVLTEHGADFDLFGFVTDTLELVGLEQVNVAHLNAAGPLLRERALVGSIILYESEPGTWARASTAAVMERLDTEWLRRLSLELLAGWRRAG
jgi:predicted nucleotidyltransferase